ncbi:MAG TPA: ORF6N domain-containing protein [Steroidobacteraceae bacterium]|nr:ORF6N domain-containing protein [Steroidobacteraceae bacterium]
MNSDHVHLQQIARAILVLRGQRVILDRDLAVLYGVTTKRFNEAVKRNAARFPADFRFQLTREEADRSRSQFATLNVGRGQNLKYLPHAYRLHCKRRVSSESNLSLAAGAAP